jgi:hypothetical protein
MSRYIPSCHQYAVTNKLPYTCNDYMASIAALTMQPTPVIWITFVVLQLPACRSRYTSARQLLPCCPFPSPFTWQKSFCTTSSQSWLPYSVTAAHQTPARTASPLQLAHR